jgi:hypothetical protein
MSQILPPSADSVRGTFANTGPWQHYRPGSRRVSLSFDAADSWAPEDDASAPSAARPLQSPETE